MYLGVAQIVVKGHRSRSLGWRPARPHGVAAMVAGTLCGRCCQSSTRGSSAITSATLPGPLRSGFPWARPRASQAGQARSCTKVARADGGISLTICGTAGSPGAHSPSMAPSRWSRQTARYGWPEAPGGPPSAEICGESKQRFSGPVRAGPVPDQCLVTAHADRSGIEHGHLTEFLTKHPQQALRWKAPTMASPLAARRLRQRQNCPHRDSVSAPARPWPLALAPLRGAANASSHPAR